MSSSAFKEKYSVLNNLPIGVFVLDDNYKILFWNICIASWTKKDSDEMVGCQIGDVYPKFKEDLYQSRINPILAGGPPTIFSSQAHGHLFPCRLPDGKRRILHTTVSNIPAVEKGRFFAMFAVKDVTELSYRIMDYRKIQQQAQEEIEQRKAVEGELRKANEKILAQTKAVIEEERLKVLLQMAGATAHELNQPLMILLGNIELLEMDRQNPKKLIEHIGKINKAGKRIADIIKKIQKVRHVAKKSYSGGDDIIDIYQKERLLCVEDDHACFKMIKAMLDRSGHKDVSHADTLEKAKKMLNDARFDLMILDYLLPDGDAFDLLEFLRHQEIHLPVVVLTGHGDEATASQLFRKGATDYLSKAHLSKKSLKESIEFSLEQSYLKRDKERAMLVMGDLSTKDELTGLFNRRYFMEALVRETSGTDRYDQSLALCLMDIDHFKTVNDTYGNIIGDKVLKRIAGFIMAALRKYDVPCRYGGEEFGILLPNTGGAGAQSVCNRIREDVEAHMFEYGGFSFNVTLSVGIALRTKSDEKGGALSGEYLIQMADTALYRAKTEGRNRVIVL